MAKPVITDKPVIDQAEFNGVTIWRKEGGSIEVSDTNYPSMKAALQDIATKAGIKLEEGWNTQYTGWYLIQRLKEIKTDCHPVEYVPPIPSDIINIQLSVSGTLEDYCATHRIAEKSITALSLHGQMNDDDTSFLRHSVESLKFLDLQDGYLDKIEDFMFDGCENLETILLPSSVKRIGDSAFRNCKKLSYLNIPSNVDFISEWAFIGCNSLDHLTISPDNQHYEMVENCLVSKREPSIILWGRGDKIPNGLSSIKYGEYNCGGYKTLTIPDSFYVPDGNLKISNRDSLISVKVNASHPHYKEGGNSILNEDASVLLMGTNASEIPNTVKKINTRAFLGCTSLEKISIPKGVESIDSLAFYGCKALQNIIIPASVIDIGEDAFFECENLFCVELSYGLETIGHEAFGGCESLESIVIPSTVTSIGNSAFGWCRKLLTITILRETPPKIGTYVFPDVHKIIVPKGTLSSYKISWSEYSNKLVESEE